MSELYIESGASEDAGLLLESAERLARLISGTLVTSGFRGRLYGLQIISADLGEGELRKVWLQTQNDNAGATA